jgi:hypothetical protein
MRPRGARACRSWFAGPVSGHPQAPGCYKVILRKVRIEIGVALREARTASLSERPVMKARVGNKAEALENSAILELLRVPDQERAIAILAVEISGKAVSDVIDAAARIGHGEQIHNRSGRIGDGNFGRTAPFAFKAEQTFFRDVMKHEDCALGCHSPFDDAARCEDDGFVKKLLGQIPVMGGRPAPDIAFAEQRGHQHPRIS